VGSNATVFDFRNRSSIAKTFIAHNFLGLYNFLPCMDIFKVLLSSAIKVRVFELVSKFITHTHG